MKRWLNTITGMFICLATPFAAGQDDAGWDELAALADGREPIQTYAADFRQEKFTPLLREPIVSHGRVVTLDGEDGGSRWDTSAPYTSTMVIARGVLHLYYPEQKTLEIYDLGDRLDALATSPVPDMAVLQDNFTLESSDWNADRTLLSLVLLPKNEQMQQALQEVAVGVDARLGTLRTLSLTDLDDETTVMHFENIVLNPVLEPGVLQLDIPADTKTVRPLDAVDG